MGKPALLGGVNVSDDEMKKLKSLARKGVGIDKRAEEYKKKIAALDEDIRALKTLGDSAGNNFIVLKEGINQITAGKNGNNLLDDSRAPEGIYVFTNADDVITSLDADDMLAVISEDGSQVYLIQVIMVSSIDGSVTITANPNPELMVFTDYVKISMDSELLEDGIVDMSDADDGVVWLQDPDDPAYDITIDYDADAQVMAASSDYAMIMPLSDIDVGGSVKANLSYGITYERGVFKATGKVTGTVKASISVIYDIVLFGPDYFETKVTVEAEIEAKLKAEVFADNSNATDTIKLGTVWFPTPIAAVTIEAKLTAPIRWEVSAGIVATAKAKIELGFKFGTGGYQPIKSITATADIYAEGVASIKFGPKLSLGINALGGTVTAELYAEAGLEVEATAIYNPTPEATTGSSRHLCELCATITVDRYVATGFEYKATILNINDLTWSKNVTFAEWRLHLGKFFASIINAPDSIYGGHFKFGAGDCQNVESRTAGTLRGNVKDAESFQALRDVSVRVYQGSALKSSTTTDSSGDYAVSLPAGDYRVVIQATNYQLFESYESVEEGRESYLETFLMVTDVVGNGTTSGTIRDAITGNVLSGVTLVVRNGWNNSTEGTIIGTLTTNGSGAYTATLPYGNYTLTATKDYYITATINIVVTRTATVKNATLAPVESDDIYRVVLTWGASPRDLDSHLRSNNAHVYYSQKYSSYAWLDVDKTTSYGPETITIENLSALGGFEYMVHDYTNRYMSSGAVALANSSAMVSVYKGSALIRTYHVPVSGDGTVWNVFSMNASGQITDINTFSYESSPPAVGALMRPFSFGDELKDYELDAGNVYDEIPAVEADDAIEISLAA
jgi:hypothetical protein